MERVVAFLSTILLVGLFASGVFAGEKRKVILDDDGFTMAQLMVTQSPDVDVLGLTVVSGNAWRDALVAKALRDLEIMDRTDIPVVPGASFPLLNTEKRTEHWESLYGNLVWKGAWMKEWVEPTEQSLPPYHGPYDIPDLPRGAPSIEPANEIAANFLIRKVRKYPGEVSIIATGPLTNIALAQRLDPEFAHLAKELIYMGGSLNPAQQLESLAAEQFAREFVNTPRREFNFRFDPEAAAIALRAPWNRMVMIPVDPSTYTELTPELIDRVSATQTPIAELLGDLESGFPLWDEIATAVWLEPELISQADQLYVDVNTTMGPSYGDTISWAEGYQPELGEQKQRIVLEVDVESMEELMVERLTGPVPSPSYNNSRAE